MKVGISTACFYPLTNTEDTLDIIKSLGFDLCEIFLEAQVELKEDFCYKLREKSEKLGMEIYSIHAFNAGFEPFLFDRYPRRKEEMEGIFKSVCKAGNILGAKYYTFHGITRNMPISNMEDIVCGMNRLIYIAKEFNIRLSWENVSWCKTGELDFVKEINKKINKEIFYTLDIKQAIRSNSLPIEYIDIYKSRLSTVHINDASENSTCLLPGQGNINLKEIIDNVKEINPDIPFIIEVYRENFSSYSKLSKAKEYLHNLGERKK